jgi:hypothetical protein
MKTRQGFVSNSSSSSFVCNVYSDHFKVTEMGEVKKCLVKMLKCMKILGLIRPRTRFSSVFQEPRRATKADIAELNDGWGAGLEYHEGMFLINSTRDNSIPYAFFGVIEDAFGARRVHLG